MSARVKADGNSMSSHDRQRRASTDAPAGRTRRPIQARLEVGPVDDPMEVEAEATADRVIAAIQATGGAQASAAARSPIGSIRRVEEEEPLQGSRIARDPVAVNDDTELEKEADTMGAKALQGSRVVRAGAEEEEPLQGSRVARSSDQEDPDPTSDDEEALQGSRIARASVIGAEGGAVDPELEARLTAGGGAPLPEPVRATMEGAFGADFSSVRVSENAAAADIGARAYTTGSDIRFAPGQFKPDSTEGQHLLAHELTHVVQQGAAAARSVVRRDVVADAKLSPADIAEMNKKVCFQSVAFVLNKLGKNVDAGSLQDFGGKVAASAGEIPDGAVVNFMRRDYGAKTWDDLFVASRHTMLSVGGGSGWATNNGALGGSPAWSQTGFDQMVEWAVVEGEMRAWPKGLPPEQRKPASELLVVYGMP